MIAVAFDISDGAIRQVATKSAERGLSIWRDKGSNVMGARCATSLVGYLVKNKNQVYSFGETGRGFKLLYELTNRSASALCVASGQRDLLRDYVADCNCGATLLQFTSGKPFAPAYEHPACAQTAARLFALCSSVLARTYGKLFVRGTAWVLPAGAETVRPACVIAAVSYF